MKISALDMVLEVIIIIETRPPHPETESGLGGAISLANVEIAVVFLEIKQHKLSIENHLWPNT